MKKMDIRNKIVEHKDDIREAAAWIVSIPVTIVVGDKIDARIHPETLIGRVGVDILKAGVQATTKVAADASFKQIDKIGGKIKQKISEKKKGIHYAEYEVVNEATA